MRTILSIQFATHCMKSHNVGKFVDIYKNNYLKSVTFHAIGKKLTFIFFLYKVYQYSKVSAFEIAPEIC